MPNITVVLNTTDKHHALHDVLATAKQLARIGESYATNLLKLFGNAQPLPYAAFAGLAIDNAPYDYWLKATPVHIVTSHNDAYLTQYHDLAVSAAEAQQLITELTQLLPTQD